MDCLGEPELLLSYADRETLDALHQQSCKLYQLIVRTQTVSRSCTCQHFSPGGDKKFGRHQSKLTIQVCFHEVQHFPKIRSIKSLWKHPGDTRLVRGADNASDVTYSTGIAYS